MQPRHARRAPAALSHPPASPPQRRREAAARQSGSPSVLCMQVGETEPFIQELLNALTATIQDLQTHQIHMFFEAVGLMISADSDKQRREQYLVRCVDDWNIVMVQCYRK